MSKTNNLIITSMTISMLGACALEGAEDGAEITAAAHQEVGGAREIRLRAIAAGDLVESDDEVYLTAKAVNQPGINVIRPTGIPDYWLFDALETHYMDLRVGQLTPDGDSVTIKLREQGDPTDGTIGKFQLNLSPTGSVLFSDPDDASYHGTNAQGWHRFKLTGEGGAYMVYLDIAD
jgi:hypothetical protein